MEWGYAIGGLVIGVICGYLGRYILAIKSREAAERRAEQVLHDAKRDAETMRKEASIKGKGELLGQREKLESEIRNERNEIKRIETRLSKREDNLDHKVDMLDKKEDQLRSQEAKIERRSEDLQQREDAVAKAEEERQHKLLAVAQMTKEEARKEVIGEAEKELEHEMMLMIDRYESRAKEAGEDKARKIVADIIERCAVDFISDSVVSSVELPGDEMKGRIIGREGRNIRAFESATGIDVIVDDTPGVVVLSGFEPVRREIAVRAMTKLVQDGRIHPARIEEVVIKTQEEIDKHIEETGKAVALELDLRGMKPRLIKLIGRLKYRTSYGQNQLDHSREVAYISGMIAAQLGLDESLARRCGLLHDIGKALDQEAEGTHPELGAEVARLCSEPSEVIAAMLEHHGTTGTTSIYATIVAAADAISASRPGARRESLERYVKRLERLEEIANSYDGVDKTFAIQAGRELRVIVNAKQLDDKACHRVCRQIAKQIEDELTYPGEVRVTMIRETRVSEYAR